MTEKKERKKFTIKGEDLFDEKRTYTFLLMDAETGLRFFHNYISDMIEAIPTIKSFFTFEGKKNLKDVKLKDIEKEKIGLKVLEIVRFLPEFLSLEKTKDMAQAMLAGATVVIGDATHEVDDSGIGDYTIGDPLEIYISLFAAIRANYPKYIDPLLGALVTQKNQGENENDTN